MSCCVGGREGQFAASCSKRSMLSAQCSRRYSGGGLVGFRKQARIMDKICNGLNNISLKTGRFEISPLLCKYLVVWFLEQQEVQRRTPAAKASSLRGSVQLNVIVVH